MLTDVKYALEKIGLKFGESQITAIEFQVEGRPLIKKNSKNIWFNRKTGKRFVGSNANYAKFSGGQLDQLMQFKQQMHLRHLFPIKENLVVSYEFHFQDRKLPDVSNVLESINDLMQQCEMIENDKQIAMILAPIRVLNSEWTGTKVKLWWSPDIKLTGGDLPKKKPVSKKKAKDPFREEKELAKEANNNLE